MPPANVLFTTVFAERLGGSEEVLWSLLRLHDPEILRPSVVFHRPGPFVEEVRGLGLHAVVVPTGRFREPHRFAAAAWRIAQEARRTEADLLAHWLNRAQVYGGVAAILAGRRRRTMWFQRHLPDGSDPLDRVGTRLPALAVGTPSAGAARAQATLLRPRRPTFHVHNGIAPRPAPSAAELEAVRLRQGLPDDRPLVGIVGRLQRWKGQHRFLRALALLRDQGVAAHGVVVGGTLEGVEEEYADELQALCDELALRDRVTFVGQVPDPAPYFALFDVTVSASDEESFGLVLLEAMAAGSPVVAVDHGGPAEILDDGRTGVLVARATPEHLAEGVAGLLADAGRREAMAAAARRELAERFTIERMVRELEQHLAALARGRVPAQDDQGRG